MFPRDFVRFGTGVRLCNVVQTEKEEEKHPPISGEVICQSLCCERKKESMAWERESLTIVSSSPETTSFSSSAPTWSVVRSSAVTLTPCCSSTSQIAVIEF